MAGKFTNYTLQKNVACWKNFETVRNFHFKTGNGKNIPTQNHFYFHKKRKTEDNPFLFRKTL